MKKLFALLLVAMLLLSGCDLAAATTKTHTVGEATLSLPVTFIDYTGTSTAEGKDFLFASSSMGVVGLKESKADITAYFGAKDLNGYAQLIAELYELDVTVSTKEGHPTFTYTQTVDGESYTYVSVFHETQNYFWNVQAYCQTSEYSKNADKLWGYASNVTFTNSATNSPAIDETEPAVDETTEPVVENPVEETTEPVLEESTDLYTLYLDPGFLNYSNTQAAEGYAFLYASEEIGILGVQDNKAELYEYFDEMDLEGYANLIAELYELDAVATQKDGIWTLTYTSDISGTSYTYVCAFHETDADFWNVQAYCITEDFDTYEADIWRYISTVEFAE